MRRRPGASPVMREEINAAQQGIGKSASTRCFDPSGLFWKRKNSIYHQDPGDSDRCYNDTPLSFKSSWNWRLKLAMEKKTEPLKCCFYNAISLYQRVFSWKRGFQTRLRHTYTWPTMDRSSCATGTVISVWWPEDFGNLPSKIDPNFEFLILCISMGAALTSSLVFLAGRATAEELLGPQNVQEIMLFIAVGIKQRAWKKWQTDANNVLEIWLLNTY